ncbi:MAG: hypothetical protein LBD45_03690 [Bacteroidales bacterium]|jgi:hypothetical protein|nr:hypothetical protein [Bacteroidales bacterium]
MTYSIKIKQLMLIVLFSMALTACKHEKDPQEMSKYYGVWASGNAELVQTKKYTLIFYRNGDTIETYLRENKIVNDTLYNFLVLGYIFNTQTKEYEKIKSDINTGKPYNSFARFIDQKDQKLEISLNERKIKLEKIESLTRTSRNQRGKKVLLL